MSLFPPSIVLYCGFRVFISFIFMGFVNVNYILEDWKKSLIKTETLEKENIRAKLEALQTQLSPHFLFNNFNIIDALIETEPKLARKYVQGLSTVFRYILDNKNKELIALKEELQFIKEFMFLIETRFDKNVSLEVNIEGSTYKKMVPPMSLQLLIENAIKHNEISNRNKLEIVIQEMANKYLSIPNNVKLRKGKFSNTGTGLKKHRWKVWLPDWKRSDRQFIRPSFSNSHTIITNRFFWRTKNILIIEDEPIAANKIKDILKSVMSKAILGPVLDTIDESVAYLKDNTPDLIFLDIELADGSCFEIFKAIEISSPIIFTTAYNQYAIQAFEVNSVDYLLKPITKESVSNALKNL